MSAFDEAVAAGIITSDEACVVRAAFPTSRRHPRTLLEAFPRTVEYAQAADPHIDFTRPRRKARNLCCAALCLAVFAALGVLLAWRG